MSIHLSPPISTHGDEGAPENPSAPRLRVALVNPPDPSNAPGFRRAAPLGLGYLASVSRGNGFHVDIFDLVSDQGINAGQLDRIGLFGQYDVYGFGTYTESFLETIRILGLVRAHKPRARFVLGGYHATIMWREVMRDFPEVDAIALNEADFTFTQLLLAWSEGQQIPLLPGVVVRDLGGQPILPGDQPAAIDLARVPFPVRELAYQRYPYEQFAHAKTRRRKKILHVVSSRGCPKRCTFCAIIVMSPKWRRRSVDSMMAEIALNYERDPFGHVMFQDANFFVDFRRTRAFARALYEFDPQITWSGTATADHVVKHEEVLQEIGSLNCAYLEIGIESGNAGSLGRFNKWTDPAINRRALAMLERADIPLGLDFIMFEQWMSVDEVRENLEFIQSTELGDYWPAEHFHSVLKLYPGTPIRSSFTERHPEVRLPDHLIPAIAFEDPGVGMIVAAIDRYVSLVQQKTDQLIETARALQGEMLDRAAVTPDRVTRRRLQEVQRCEIMLRLLPAAFLRRVLDRHQAGAHRDLFDAAGIGQDRAVQAAAEKCIETWTDALSMGVAS